MAFNPASRDVRIAARSLLEKVVAKLCGAATKTQDTEDCDDEVDMQAEPSADELLSPEIKKIITALSERLLESLK